ncbi:hypothetical protein MMC24_002642 [Lignoscripta atroalba]|nr:hypothetical protein [Lignoscripta atroalba]
MSALGTWNAGTDPSAGLAGLPAQAPPPGVVPNFIDPYSRGPMLVIVSSILIGLMVLFVAARLYTKLRINRKLKWDDLTCVLAMLGAITYTITCILLVRTSIGPHQYNVYAASLAADSFHSQFFVVNIVPAPTLLCAKLTFFLLHLQIFAPKVALRYCIYFGVIVVTLFYTAVTIFQIIANTPRRGESWLQRSQSPLIEYTKTLGIVRAYFGMLSDFYILILPIPGVWALQLHQRRKAGVMAIFMTGLLVCITSILSVYYQMILRHINNDDFTWHLLPVLMLTIAEMTIGVTCSCMPAFACMLRHHLPPYESLKSLLLSRVKSLATVLTRRTGSQCSRSDGPSTTPSFSECSKTFTPKTHPSANVSWQSRDRCTSDSRTQSRYELGQMRTTRTYIKGGMRTDVHDDGIHLKQEVQQSWIDLSPEEIRAAYGDSPV